MTCRLKEARPRTPYALPAPMAHVIALTALAALGLPRAPFHETFHTRGNVGERDDEDQIFQVGRTSLAVLGPALGAHTAPEAARVIARTLALTCADCTNGGGGGGGGRSAHVPDHHLSGLGDCQTIAWDDPSQDLRCDGGED